MSNDNLQVNKKIEIEVKNGPYQGTYASKIAALDEDEIKILPPMLRGEIVPLRENTRVKIYFTGDDAAYVFSSRVIKRVKEKIKLLVLTPPEEIVRIQRRDYFRLEVKLEAQYRRLNQELEPEEDFITTQTVDISGGGVRLALENELAKNDVVEVILAIPDIKDLPLIGEVRQLYEMSQGKAAGIEFTNLNSHLRDVIIGWLFDYQRKLRKKGLL